MDKTVKKIKTNAQQRFAKMAKYVVNSRLSFARYFILAEKSRLRSSPLLQAAKRYLQTKQTIVNRIKKIVLILTLLLGVNTNCMAQEITIEEAMSSKEINEYIEDWNVKKVDKIEDIEKFNDLINKWMTK